MGQNDFDLAFVYLMQRTLAIRLGKRSSFDVTPWSDYHWGLPLEQSCPSLVIVRHMHDCVGKTGADVLMDAQYIATATRFMYIGICAVPWYDDSSSAPRNATPLLFCPSQDWCQTQGVFNLSTSFLTNTHFGMWVHGGKGFVDRFAF